jgi:hypothetical protein
MKDSIRIHPQHGLNPTLPVCWWCGEETGEVALLGAAFKGEAPHRMVLNRAPCPKCTEQMARGITLIQATEATRGNPPQMTGRWCVMTEDAVRRIFSADVLDNVLQHRKAMLSIDAWKHMGLPTDEQDEKTTPVDGE